VNQSNAIPNASAAGTLIFDGDCAFCTSSARWLQRRLPHHAEVMPWQAADLARFGLCPAQVSTAAYWIDTDGRAWRGHRGIARALTASTGAWPILGRVMELPGPRQVAAVGYALVARFRHRLPGGTPACRRDQAESEGNTLA
jgi:predicted DCC family thiol-disulfide oxidoreductase YuxK